MDYQSKLTKPLRLHWFVYLLLALSLVAIGLQGLRQNNERMGELKAAVITADETGEGVDLALQDLGSFVFNHMNTTTQVTLASEYSRDAQAAIEASQPDDIGAEVYEQARVECENPNVPLTARASCIAEYVSANGPDVDTDPIELPAESSYVYAFSAPLWSADVAGLSLFVAVVVGGLAVTSWLRSE